MNIQVLVQAKGANIRQIFETIVAKSEEEFKVQLEIIAEHAAQSMREHIQSSKKRPSLGSNLEDSIQVEDIWRFVKGYGIGNIQVLKAQAPYFECLDVGGYVPYSTVKAAPYGVFAPGEGKPMGGWSGQNWEKSGEKGYFMQPKKPITGIGYIEVGMSYIEQAIKEIKLKGI